METTETRSWLDIALSHLDGAATALRQHGDEYRAQLIEAGAHAIRRGEAGMSGWRTDFENAPRDRDIMLWLPGHRVVIGRWITTTGRVSDIGGIWCAAYYSAPFSTNPTHWREVDPPPGLKVAP